MAVSPDVFNGAARLDVADAFMEMVNAGQLEPEVADEIIPRLIPESYPDIQDWYTGNVPPEVAAATGEALEALAIKRRLNDEQTAHARQFLGIISAAA